VQAASSCRTLSDLFRCDWIDSSNAATRSGRQRAGLGGRFRPGLVRSDPRGGKLKKSRRNRGALHGDFHISEANVFANYAFALISIAIRSC
jgi:hypothetical protein